MNLDTFINTGTSHQIVIRQKNAVKARSVRIQTNDQASYYFCETRMTKSIVALGKDTKSLAKKKTYERVYDGTISRTCSLLNLFDLQLIKASLEKEDDFFIDETTILSTYQGHTIFSIFLHKMEVYEQILTQLNAQEYEDEVSMKKIVESNVLKRLYRILSTPTADLKGIQQEDRKKNPDVNCKFCAPPKKTEVTKNAFFERIRDVFGAKDEEIKCACRGFYTISLKSVHF